MTRSLSFVVDAEPVAQGSMQARVTKDGRAYMHHDNETKVRRFRREIRDAANGQRITAIRQVPLTITMAFNTKYAPKSRTDVHDGDYDATGLDLDKICRASFDGLQESKVVTNDAQFVALHASKRYGRPGASITISDIPLPRTPIQQVLWHVACIARLWPRIDVRDLPRALVGPITHLATYQGEPA